MKFSQSILVAFVSADFASESFTNPRMKTFVHRNTSPENAVKRYYQLTDMMTHYDSGFDEKKMWSYGCHCMFLGDRPMSGMGSGKPVDTFDKVCQEYKNCQKCAREEHGETCIGEFINYDMNIEQGRVLKCRSKPGSCERELCECDKKFAQSWSNLMKNDADDWNMNYQRFENPDFDEDSICQPGISAGENDPQCCNTDARDAAYFMYNANNQCCINGEVYLHGNGACESNL
jgi:hypothetical protein